jgi:hypothetical protein
MNPNFEHDTATSTCHCVFAGSRCHSVFIARPHPMGLLSDVQLEPVLEILGQICGFMTSRPPLRHQVQTDLWKTTFSLF